MDSMHTLFMAITGGLNWFDAYAPLRKVSLMALWLMLLGFRGGEDMQRLAGGEQTQQPRRVSQKIWEIRIAWIFAPRALGDHGQILERCWEDECEWHAKGCLVGWRRPLGTCSS